MLVRKRSSRAFSVCAAVTCALRAWIKERISLTSVTTRVQSKGVCFPAEEGLTTGGVEPARLMGVAGVGSGLVRWPGVLAGVPRSMTGDEGLVLRCSKRERKLLTSTLPEPEEAVESVTPGLRERVTGEGHVPAKRFFA